MAKFRNRINQISHFNQLVQSLLKEADGLLEKGPLDPERAANLLKSAALAIEELYDMAHTDTLTQIANSLYYKECVVDKLEAFCRGNNREDVAEYIFGIADLNGLKQINDTIGYQAGDAMLIKAVLKIKSLLRPEDLIVRRSDFADEFIIILPVYRGLPDNLEKIEKGIVKRLTDDQALMAVGFVYLSQYKKFDEAEIAAVKAMHQHKAFKNRPLA